MKQSLLDTWEKEAEKTNRDANIATIGSIILCIFSIFVVWGSIKFIKSGLEATDNAKAKAKEEYAQQILSQTHSNAFLESFVIDSAEYDRIMFKEIDTRTAKWDSAYAAQRIIDIVNQDAVLDTTHKPSIPGILTKTIHTVNPKSLDNNPYLARARQDYRDAIIFLNKERITKNRL